MDEYKLWIRNLEKEAKRQGHDLLRTTHTRVMTEHERALVTGGGEKVAGVLVRSEADVDREARKGTPLSVYRILAHRTGGSVMGPAVAWAKRGDDQIVEFATAEEAEAQAREWNDRNTSPNVFYTVRKLP
jgi:hypothetical protein